MPEPFGRTRYEAWAYNFFEPYFCYGETKLYAHNKVAGDARKVLF